MANPSETIRYPDIDRPFSTDLTLIPGQNAVVLNNEMILAFLYPKHHTERKKLMITRPSNMVVGIEDLDSPLGFDPRRFKSNDDFDITFILLRHDSRVYVGTNYKLDFSNASPYSDVPSTFTLFSQSTIEAAYIPFKSDFRDLLRKSSSEKRA